MQASDLPLHELDAGFITHYHNDHYANLGDVMEWSWILGRRHILPVYGPTGIAQIVDGFQSAYELEWSYRTAHHGEEVMPTIDCSMKRKSANWQPEAGSILRTMRTPRAK